MAVAAVRGVPAGIDVPEAVLDPARVAAVRVALPTALRGRRVLDRVAALGVASLDGCAGRVSIVTDEYVLVVGSTTGQASRLALDEGLCPYVVAHRAPMTVEDLREDPVARTLPLVHEPGGVAFAAAPIIVSGRALGAVAVWADTPRAFSADDLALLEDLAGAVEHQLGRPSA